MSSHSAPDYLITDYLDDEIRDPIEMLDRYGNTTLIALLLPIGRATRLLRLERQAGIGHFHLGGLAVTRSCRAGLLQSTFRFNSRIWQMTCWSLLP